MKKFFKFIFNLIVYIIIIASFIYLLANAVLYLLPAEIKEEIIATLHLSTQTMSTLTATASINLAILIVAKFGQRQAKLALHKKLAEVNAVLQETSSLNDIVAEKTEQVLNNQQVLEELIFALLEVQKVNVVRNLKASATLVQEVEKEAYMRALQAIDRAIEKYKQLEEMQAVVTKTKEIIVERVVEGKEGRI